MYGERGLAGAEAAVWALGETLTVEYATDTLAQYTVAYEPDKRHIREATASRLFATRYPAPQPFLAALEAVEWRRALRLPHYQARRKPREGGGQAELFPLEGAGWSEG